MKASAIERQRSYRNTIAYKIDQTGKVDVHAVGPCTEGETNHRGERTHSKQHTCSYNMILTSFCH